MGSHKNNLVISILCVLMFGAVPLQADVDIPYDSSGFDYGKNLEKHKKYAKAWGHYQKQIKRKSDEKEPTLIDLSDGDYRDRQSFYLKRMAHLMRYKKISRAMKYRAQLFFNEHFKSYKSPREREKIMKEAYEYLPTKIGFHMFKLLGDRSAEAGDCVKAVYLWENAKENSSGYASLDNKNKIRFLTRLGRCYKKLGFRDKLKTLLKEMPELSKVEANLKEEKLIKDFEHIKKVLKEFHSFLSSCPTNKNKSQSLNKQFTITKHKEEVITNIFVKNTKLCFKGKKRWCIEEAEFAFLSHPLVLGNYVYIVGKDLQKNDLFLLTIDKNRGKVLKKTYFGTIQGKGVPFSDTFYPYKLYIKNGKIQLTTEPTHNEFYLNGSLAHVIDLKHPKNKNLGIITADALTFTLLNPNLRDVGQTIQKIQKLGGSLEGVVRFLVQGLASGDRVFARRAAEALGNMGQKAVSAIPALITALGDKDVEVRSSVIKALEKMGEKAIPALTTALRDKKSYVRLKVVEALGDMGQKAIPALTHALEDKNWAVRSNAVRALGKMGEKAVLALTTALRDKKSYVRSRAADTLGRMGQKAVSAIPALTTALKDKDSDVRSQAADTLGRMGEKASSAILALTHALEDKKFQVRVSAALALGEMGEKAVSATPVLTHALEDTEWGVRASAATALGRIGQKASFAIPALTTALGDKDSDVRFRAADALGVMGEKAVSAIPALTQALEDEHWLVRSRAAVALGKMGQKASSAIPALTKLLEDQPNEVQRGARQALKKIRGKK